MLRTVGCAGIGGPRNVRRRYPSKREMICKEFTAARRRWQAERTPRPPNNWEMAATVTNPEHAPHSLPGGADAARAPC